MFGRGLGALQQASADHFVDRPEKIPFRESFGFMNGSHQLTGENAPRTTLFSEVVSDAPLGVE
jgi:hypothetical protein